MSIGAPECLAHNCSRKTWDGFCWQHRAMRRSLSSGPRNSVVTYSSPAPPKLVSSGESEAVRALALIASSSGRGHPSTYADMTDAALSHLDAAVNEYALKFMPLMDKMLGDGGYPRSEGYDAIRAGLVGANSLSTASMSPEDFEEYYKATDTTGTDLRRSYTDERFIANYGLRMAWEVAQHRGDQNASCGAPGVTWGDDYQSFLSRFSDYVGEREIGVSTNILRNWDWYVQNGTGGHAPMTRPGETVDAYDARHLGTSTALSRAKVFIEQNKKKQPEPQKPKPAPVVAKPVQTPKNIGAAIPPPPVYERFDVPQPNAGVQPQHPQNSSSTGDFFGALANGFSKAADGVAKRIEREVKLRREAEEKRKREEAAEAKKRAEQKRKVDEWALNHGYTPEEWAAEKESKKKMREHTQRNQELQGAYYSSGTRRNHEIADKIVRDKWRRRLGGR